MTERIKPRLRDKFLMQYAEALRTELNQFTEGGAVVHKASVLAGRSSQVVIEFLPLGEPWAELKLTRQPDDWLPKRNAIIEFHAPNRVTVTRSSEWFDEMLQWSNVKAWEDAGFIIGHILMTKRHSLDDDELFDDEGVDDPYHVCGCPMPGCIMSGPHFESECCTAQQAADYQESLEVRI
jgi:hypothetical protein